MQRSVFDWRGPTQLAWTSKTEKQIKQDAKRKNKTVDFSAYKGKKK